MLPSWESPTLSGNAQVALDSSNYSPAVQVAHVRQLGVPHLVVAFDQKVEEACRENSIPYHRDDEGTVEGYVSVSP